MPVEIRLSNFTKRIGRATIVDGLDLTIPKGRMMFILGPSGCGKTTLLRMIAGLTELSAGTIRFGERDVTNLPTRRRNIGMMFQSYALWPHMTVVDNVAFGLEMRKVPRRERRRRASEMLDRVGLDGMGARRPGQLSGGQQQRVALARSLVVEPDVLLLDEPLSNLDANLRLQLRELVRDLCRQTGVTTIYVTHDQEEAMSLADEIVVMRTGRIEQRGGPAEIYARPNTVAVAKFLGETNLIDAKIAQVDGERVELESPIGRLESTVVRAPASGRAPVVCSIRPESWRIVEGGAPAGPGPNRVEGVLLDSTRRGLWSRHHVRLDSGVELIVHEPGTPVRAVDERCTLEADPGSVVVLPPEGGTPAATPAPAPVVGAARA